MLLKLGIWRPEGLPESFRVCIDGIKPGLVDAGVECVEFANLDQIPQSMDVLWDPRAGGAALPAEALFEAGAPVVITLHGVAPLALPWRYARTMRQRFWLWRSNQKVRREWRKLRGKFAAIVAVSNAGKLSIVQHLSIDPLQISVCPNAVDHRVFGVADEPSKGPPYFFHISNDEPRKNVDRIVRAYRKLPENRRWPLVLKLPSVRPELMCPGVEIVTERLGDEALLEMYQSAGCFVFPSFYEGFGLPILEAMASGCSVITSNSSACAEVAGEAAILIDPKSVSQLKVALGNIQNNGELRSALVTKGRLRSLVFSWDDTASAYLRVFKAAVDKKP